MYLYLVVYLPTVFNIYTDTHVFIFGGLLPTVFNIYTDTHVFIFGGLLTYCVQHIH